jgi:hypothetical protein
MLEKVVQTLVDEKMGIRRYHFEEEHVQGYSINNAKLDLSDNEFCFWKTDCTSSRAWKIICTLLRDSGQPGGFESWFQRQLRHTPRSIAGIEAEADARTWVANLVHNPMPFLQ